MKHQKSDKVMGAEYGIFIGGVLIGIIIGAFIGVYIGVATYKRNDNINVRKNGQSNIT